MGETLPSELPASSPTSLPAKPMIGLPGGAPIPAFFGYAAIAAVGAGVAAGQLSVPRGWLTAFAAFAVGVVLGYRREAARPGLYYERVGMPARLVTPGCWILSSEHGRTVTQVVATEEDIAGLRCAVIGADGTRRYSAPGSTQVEIVRIAGGDVAVAECIAELAGTRAAEGSAA